MCVYSIPTSASDRASAGPLKCGMRRERGRLRTSTTRSTSWARSSARNSSSVRVECPIVRSRIAMRRSYSLPKPLESLSCRFVERVRLELAAIRGNRFAPVAEFLPGLAHLLVLVFDRALERTLLFELGDRVAVRAGDEIEIAEPPMRTQRARIDGERRVQMTSRGIGIAIEEVEAGEIRVRPSVERRAPRATFELRA